MAPTMRNLPWPGTFLFACTAALLPAQDPGGEAMQAMQRELDAARRELAELRATLAAQSSAAAPIPVSGSFGMALTNEYLFRGIPQEDRGVIAQPWAELGFGVYSGAADVRGVTLRAGIWNSVHDGPTGGAGGVWYETDVYGGATVQLGDRWRIGALYTAYHSPNGSFATVQEVAGTLAFDDADGWLPVALQPSLLVAFETRGQADAGAARGSYVELGITPRVALGAVDGVTTDLVVPVKLGFGLDDYYELPGGGGDEALGYVQVGLLLSLALADLPHPGTPWTLDLGLSYLVLGDSNRARNGGDRGELLAVLAIATSF